MDHETEIAAGQRFEFGENWSRFLALLDEEKIASAEASLRDMLGVDDLVGQSFLDIGSGSGLFSLAARRMGASVFSFDYDPKSVACTQELRRRYFPHDVNWVIETGSVLDRQFMRSISAVDIVYSWGVLHHTGDMWRAIENSIEKVAKGGKFFIALYNDQPIASRYWTYVKRSYNKSVFAKWVLTGVHSIHPLATGYVARRIRRRSIPRGMNAWRDLHDWLGGYPFEVSSPEQVFNFFRVKGFNLVQLKTVGGRLGCNEFVFKRDGDTNG